MTKKNAVRTTEEIFTAQPYFPIQNGPMGVVLRRVITWASVGIAEWRGPRKRLRAERRALQTDTGINLP